MDLYAVAKENVFALQNGEVSPTKTFNVLCSLEHLREWVINAPELSNIKTEAQKINDYGYKGEHSNHSMYIIRELCNEQKHFNTEKRNHSKKKNVVPKPKPETASRSGYGVARYGVGKFGVGEPSYTVTVDGKEKNFLQIVNEAMSVWDEFVEKKVKTNA